MPGRAQNASKNPGWEAELHLQFRDRGDKTVLAHRAQRGPLAVQRAFYPEGKTCHLYLLHPPGGVVGGDSLNISAEVQSGHAVVTTPGATKFYRSAGASARQSQTLRVASDAMLEWLPQENIFFPGSQSTLTTRIDLQRGARFIGWEIHCLGRPANNEPFDSGALDFRLQVYREARPLLLERLQINTPAQLHSLSGLRGCPVSASLLATGADADLLEYVHEQCGEVAPAQLGITLLDDLLVCRYLGPSTAQAHHLFTRIWTHIRPRCIGREACAPRIWNT